MTKDHFVFLGHILESIELIERYTKNLTKEKFNKYRKTRDAVVHNLEIIGEAAKNIPLSYQEKHPEIQWKEMIRTRDKLSHGYFGIDTDIVWDVIQKDLPLLKQKIKNALSEQKSPL